jgi:hypothetical protein
VANPNEFNEKAFQRAVRKLRNAVTAMWDSGASWETIEDVIEEAQIDAGVNPPSRMGRERQSS